MCLFFACIKSNPYLQRKHYWRTQMRRRDVIEPWNMSSWLLEIHQISLNLIPATVTLTHRVVGKIHDVIIPCLYMIFCTFSPKLAALQKLLIGTGRICLQDLQQWRKQVLCRSIIWDSTFHKLVQNISTSGFHGFWLLPSAPLQASMHFESLLRTFFSATVTCRLWWFGTTFDHESTGLSAP